MIYFLTNNRSSEKIFLQRNEMEDRNEKYCFGIDVGGTTVKMGLFTTEGELLDKWEIPTRKEDGGAYILNDVAASVEAKLAEKNIAKEDVAGAGIGVPGPTLDTGYVSICVNLGWKDKNPANALSELLSIPVKAGNDANVAALGEMWKGGGAGEMNVIMVTLGTGVGGGVIINGKVLVGANGAGGEIGHLCVNYEEKDKCGCGNCGCLEQYASATGIVRLAKKKLGQELRPTILTKEDVTAKDVFDAVKAGDETAKEIAVEFGRYLGYALANLAAVLDPAVIVIGGGVSKAGEVLIPYIREPFMERAFFANRNVKFALATLGNDAGICGAAKLVLED